MKRSEMVEMMGELIALEYGDILNENDRLRAFTFAKNLLGLQEDDGMLAPSLATDDDFVDDSFAEFGAYEVSNYIDTYCKWELENE